MIDVRHRLASRIGHLTVMMAMCSLAACNDQRRDPAQTSASNISSKNSGASTDERGHWNIPKAASAANKALMLKWFEDTTACVGGVGVSSEDTVCKARDANQQALRSRGWCWGAPLAKTGADSDWHRCGKYDTDSPMAADVPAEISEPTDPHAGDWYDEKYRAKSPLLQAYENAIEPIDKKIGLAQVMLTCGIRGNDWYTQTVAALESYRHRPDIEEMRRRLNASEASSARAYSKLAIDGTLRFNLGRDTARACRTLATMPFVNDPSAFRP